MSGASTLEAVASQKPAAATPIALPCVKDLTREQRSALMLELVKAWFDDTGMPFPFVVRDGDKVLGVFKPEFHPPEKTTLPPLPPGYMEQLHQRIGDVDSGTIKTLTKEEFLSRMELELDQAHHKQCFRRNASAAAATRNSVSCAE
jgi:hypothetical protein